MAARQTIDGHAHPDFFDPPFPGLSCIRELSSSDDETCATGLDNDFRIDFQSQLRNQHVTCESTVTSLLMILSTTLRLEFGEKKECSQE